MPFILKNLLQIQEISLGVISLLESFYREFFFGSFFIVELDYKEFLNSLSLYTSSFRLSVFTPLNNPSIDFAKTHDTLNWEIIPLITSKNILLRTKRGNQQYF